MESSIELTGTLHFDLIHVSKKQLKQSSWKHVGIVKFSGDDDDYYSWFINRRYNLHLNKPARGFHFTIINDKIENLSLDEIGQLKTLFDGITVKVKLSTDVRTNGEHWWLKAESEDAENIRRAFRLNPTPYWNFHTTVGYVNQGNINKNGIAFNHAWEHSHYIHDLLKRNIIQ